LLKVVVLLFAKLAAGLSRLLHVHLDTSICLYICTHAQTDRYADRQTGTCMCSLVNHVAFASRLVYVAPKFGSKLQQETYPVARGWFLHKFYMKEAHSKHVSKHSSCAITVGRAGCPDSLDIQHAWSCHQQIIV
jgi:hypothetical protein